MEENRVLKELLEDATGRKRIILKDSHRRRLAAKGIALSKHILENIMTVFQPEKLRQYGCVYFADMGTERRMKRIIKTPS